MASDGPPAAGAPEPPRQRRQSAAPRRKSRAVVPRAYIQGLVLDEETAVLGKAALVPTGGNKPGQKRRRASTAAGGGAAPGKVGGDGPAPPLEAAAEEGAGEEVHVVVEGGGSEGPTALNKAPGPRSVEYEEVDIRASFTPCAIDLNQEERKYITLRTDEVLPSALVASEFGEQQTTLPRVEDEASFARFVFLPREPADIEREERYRRAHRSLWAKLRNHPAPDAARQTCVRLEEGESPYRMYVVPYNARSREFEVRPDSGLEQAIAQHKLQATTLQQVVSTRLNRMTRAMVPSTKHLVAAVLGALVACAAIAGVAFLLLGQDLSLVAQLDVKSLLVVVAAAAAIVAVLRAARRRYKRFRRARWHRAVAAVQAEIDQVNVKVAALEGDHGEACGAVKLVLHLTLEGEDPYFDPNSIQLLLHDSEMHRRLQRKLRNKNMFPGDLKHAVRQLKMVQRARRKLAQRAHRSHTTPTIINFLAVHVDDVVPGRGMPAGASPPGSPAPPCTPASHPLQDQQHQHQHQHQHQASAEASLVCRRCAKISAFATAQGLDALASDLCKSAQNDQEAYEAHMRAALGHEPGQSESDGAGDASAEDSEANEANEGGVAVCTICGGRAAQ